MVKFACSASAAWGFAGSDPGHRHDTAPTYQHPTQHSQKDLQLEYTTIYWGGFGEKKKKKRRLTTDVSSSANL